VRLVAVISFLFASSSALTADDVQEEQVLKDWGGKSIDWMTDIDEGFEKAKEERMPVMMQVHRIWCHACQSLQPQFAESKEIAALSKSFVMLNIYGESEPWQDEYQPDGKYVPRTMFFDSDGSLMKEIINPKTEKGYAYLHTDSEMITTAMKQALARHSVEKPKKSACPRGLKGPELPEPPSSRPPSDAHGAGTPPSGGPPMAQPPSEGREEL